MCQLFKLGITFVLKTLQFNLEGHNEFSNLPCEKCGIHSKRSKQTQREELPQI